MSEARPHWHKRSRLRAEFFVDSHGVAVAKAKPVPFAQRKRIFERDGQKCVFCNVPLKLFRGYVKFFGDYRLAHVDHVIARSRGGQNTDDNLRLLCEPCNESRGAGL